MSFTRETKVRAVRKQHRCETCCKEIATGEPAVRWAGMTDGDFHSVIMHPECRAAEVAFNELHETHYSDEWLSLAHDREADDDAWLVEAFPIVAARLNVAEVPA